MNKRQHRFRLQMLQIIIIQDKHRISHKFQQVNFNCYQVTNA